MLMNIKTDFTYANTYYNIARKRRKIQKAREKRFLTYVIMFLLSLAMMIDWDMTLFGSK